MEATFALGTFSPFFKAPFSPDIFAANFSFSQGQGESNKKGIPMRSPSLFFAFCIFHPFQIGTCILDNENNPFVRPLPDRSSDFLASREICVLRSHSNTCDSSWHGACAE